MSAKDIQEVGSKVIIILHSLSSVLKLYDSNNAAIVRQIDAFEKELNNAFEKGLAELRITLRTDEFFINDKLLKIDIQLYLRAKEVAEILGRFEWNDIRIKSTVSRDDIEKFVFGFSNSVRKTEGKLSQEGYGGITGSKAKGSSAAAFRFEPDKLAVWLYSGLLDVVDNLYELYEKGEVPSLLPVRRSLQMIIDNMRQYNGIYQMLSAFRSPELPRNAANTRVAIAIDVIGFGYFMNVPNGNLMNLALASILGGLSSSDDPLDTVVPLFRFGGLGVTAVGLITSLYDARASKQGKQVSFFGRLLMIVEFYHLSLNKEPSKPLPKLMYDMTTEVTLDSKITALFARYKGPFPIGSFVKVDNETMLVVGHSDSEEGKQRPIVMKVTNGKLGTSIDLSTSTKKSIEAVTSLSEQNFQIEELR
jgi:hypothetical protein